MEDARLELRGERWCYADLPHGCGEERPLDFHSPYGCSKGSADQYVRDYARIYGLRTVVLRQSCIYGYRQFGVEDQGWVAWFTIRSLKRAPVTIFGDGCQVRDVLFIDDLLAAYQAAIERIDVASGQVYNVGGGAGNALSLRELVRQLDALNGYPLQVAEAIGGRRSAGLHRRHPQDRSRAGLGAEGERARGPRAAAQVGQGEPDDHPVASELRPPRAGLGRLAISASSSCLSRGRISP